MAKVPVAVRLEPATLAKVDALAKARGRSRQVVLEGAVDSFLDDAERGVPDLPAEPVRAVVSSSFAADGAPNSVSMDRQRRLNEQMLRARKS